MKRKEISKVVHFFLDKKKLCGIFHNTTVYHAFKPLLLKNLTMSKKGGKMQKNQKGKVFPLYFNGKGVNLTLVSKIIRKEGEQCL